jgi:hypothetical protein
VLALSCASCRVQSNRLEYCPWSHLATQHGCPIAQASRAKAAAKMRVRHASQEKPRVALKCDTPAAPNRTQPTRSASVSKSATSESDRRAGYRARWISNRLCRRTGCRRTIVFGFQRTRSAPRRQRPSHRGMTAGCAGYLPHLPSCGRCNGPRSKHRHIEAWVVAMGWSIERTIIFCTSDP